MAKISRSIEIDAPVERVFSFMTDPNNMPEVWPSMVEVKNVERKDDGSHEFDWVYKMAGIRFEGHASASDVRKNERVVSKNASGIPSTFEYTYEKLGAGRSRLKIDCEYEIPGRLLSKLGEPFLKRINEHEAEVLLKNVKARMEMGAEAKAEAQPAPAE